MFHKRFTTTFLSMSVIGTLSFSACHPGSSGSLQFQVQLPAQQSALFQLQAIPKNTNRLSLEISGQGLNTPYTETFTADSGENRFTRNIVLPVGEKTIQVQAFQDEKLLAKGEATTTIQAGKKEQLTLTLSPVDTAPENALEITLAGIVPTDIPMTLRISGTGLAQALERKLTLPAGVNPTALLEEAFPPGEKRLEIRIQTPDGLGEQLPVIVENFTVSEEGGAELELSLEALIARYRAELSQIPELLDLLRRHAPHLLLMIEATPEPSPSPTATPVPSNGDGQIRFGEVIPSKDAAP